MKTHLQALDHLRRKQHAAGARPSRRSFDHLEPYLLDAQQKYRPVRYLLPFLRQSLLRTLRSYYAETTNVTSLPMRLNGKFQEVEVLPDGRLALDSEILPAVLLQHNRDSYYDISLAAVVLLAAQKIWALDTFGEGREHLHADICEVVEQAIELAARILVDPLSSTSTASSPDEGDHSFPLPALAQLGIHLDSSEEEEGEDEDDAPPSQPQFRPAPSSSGGGGRERQSRLASNWTSSSDSSSGNVFRPSLAPPHPHLLPA
ncbi:uncharacterized protein JCM10292_005262 [Rhodotorula paludigena]|uniref:uncharacterized protein n=1 Tax=Rhodotorula paludigena TaxID=86838 RepID=UPI0031752BB6